MTRSLTACGTAALALADRDGRDRAAQNPIDRRRRARQEGARRFTTA